MNLVNTVFCCYDSSMDKTKALNEVYEELKTKRLYDDAKSFVPGEGSPNAEILFVGEAPGQKEDEQGRPFVGAAGKFLAEMLEGIGLKREDVFITNIVKQRPPNNRDPLPEEIAAHFPLLQKQIEIINPKIIVMLGRHSMSQLLPNVGTISQVHGRPFRRADGRVYLPLYHPAAALYNAGLKDTLISDFRKISLILKKLDKEQKDLPKE
jgi:uracil-DNA glycosylase family 4